ncbi:hypothetical protein RIF23_14195 [Lipingzhangella sp. LS1_29]|uniref:Uncharacterized protein n=1 Tax=Lipingzhangella rawalii TaxID=2055835 RepID=A0ABU2H9D3_9ACTN|nr:hypothetical protein [Lipingzhangella rawalii]MDS1271445.1 hypothetical protein [Lipingzhangella rawalii]
MTRVMRRMGGASVLRSRAPRPAPEFTPAEALVPAPRPSREDRASGPRLSWILVEDESGRRRPEARWR